MKWEMEESTNKTLDHIEEIMNAHDSLLEIIQWEERKVKKSLNKFEKPTS